MADKLVHYPAVVISANEDVKVVAPEVVRRTVICRAQGGLMNTEVMKSSIVRRVQRGTGTAFYRKYLNRMLDELPEILNTIKSDDEVDAPDVLAVSSRIIYNIIKENIIGNLPAFVRELSLENYFDEKVTGANTRKAIHSAWRANKKSFVVDKKMGELRYNAGQTWEADKILKELPEILEAHRSREWVIMDLKNACDYFEVNFYKRQFFGRF